MGIYLGCFQLFTFVDMLYIFFLTFESKSKYFMIINYRAFEVKLLTRMTGSVHKNINFFKGVKVE